MHILKIFSANKGRYGSIRISKTLLKDGIKASPKRVLKLMKKLNIRPVTLKKYKPYNSKFCKEDKINILKQNFEAYYPNEKWLTDITYIYTIKDGWTYLALVMDLFSRKIVGYDYSLSMDSVITTNAIKKAIANRGKPKDLIIHSDLGPQYTCNDFENLLLDLKIKHSYSKKAYPYDNSPMESFNATLKKEEVYTTKYKDFQSAKLALFEFIEGYYNNQRIHSSIGYKTPKEYEECCYNNK